VINTHVKAAFICVLITPAMNFDIDLPSEFATEILDVYTGSAIDVRRIFSRKQGSSQGRLQSTQTKYHGTQGGLP
jgi:hypothetical protein